MVGHQIERRARLALAARAAPTIDAGSATGLDVTEARSWTLREPESGRAYTVVSVQTRSGLRGYGECAPLAPAEFAAAAKALAGLPATAWQVADQVLSPWPLARAGLITALLDVVGKATRAPVYQVLGGPTRAKARALVELGGDSDAALLSAMKRAQEAGFRAFLVPVPRTENRNQGQAYVLAVRLRLEALRAAAGPGCDFVLSGAGRMTPGDAQMVAADLEKLHLLWFDEPCPPTALAALAKLSAESVTPIGLGRHVRAESEVQDLLRMDAVDVVRPSLGEHGIARLRRMAAIAEVYYVAIAPHHDGGPIGTAAALQLAASVPQLLHPAGPLARRRTRPQGARLHRRRGDRSRPRRLPRTARRARARHQCGREGPGEWSMRRRQFFSGAAGSLLAAGARASECACSAEAALQPGAPANESPWQAGVHDRILSKVRITGVKTFGVSLTPQSDRPYVFVKLETNAGVEGWGEATLEGKAGAAMACVNDFRDLLIGSDPMQVEHHWQSMYVHSFYRAGPVMGSAISGIDQALWDIRGKLLGLPVYQLLGGPNDARGVRGYYHARARTRDELAALRQTAVRDGVSCFKTGPAGRTFEWIETSAHIDQAIASLGMIREALGPAIDIAVDFHAKTSPTVASIIVKEIEPLHLLFVEELCPPENVKAMARIARRSTTPIATGERLVASYGFRELIELGVVDILQPDINHCGGITAISKIGALAAASGISIAPHNCEGPIGGLATLHIDAALPNFVVQEVCSGVAPGPTEKVWEEWLGFPAMRMANGRFPLPTRPGLGFELKEEALKKYPFAGTRPMARVFHQDGSVAEW